MNRKEFNQIFDTCYSYCLPKLRQLTNNEVDAKEFFQEAIIRYWHLCQQGKMQHQANVPAFVFVIARNKWIDAQRKKGKQIPTDPAKLRLDLNRLVHTSAIEAFDPLVKAENQERELLLYEGKLSTFQEAWNKLSTHCQKLLTMRKLQRKSSTEIAEHFKMLNRRVAITAIARCFRKLKDYINSSNHANSN